MGGLWNKLPLSNLLKNSPPAYWRLNVGPAAIVLSNLKSMDVNCCLDGGW